MRRLRPGRTLCLIGNFSGGDSVEVVGANLKKKGGGLIKIESRFEEVAGFGKPSRHLKSHTRSYIKRKRSAFYIRKKYYIDLPTNKNNGPIFNFKVVYLITFYFTFDYKYICCSYTG